MIPFPASARASALVSSTTPVFAIDTPSGWAARRGCGPRRSRGSRSGRHRAPAAAARRPRTSRTWRSGSIRARPPTRRAELVERTVNVRADVVDEHREPAERGIRFADDRRRAPRIAQVACHGDRADTKRSGLSPAPPRRPRPRSGSARPRRIPPRERDHDARPMPRADPVTRAPPATHRSRGSQPKRRHAIDERREPPGRRRSRSPSDGRRTSRRAGRRPSAGRSGRSAAGRRRSSAAPRGSWRVGPNEPERNAIGSTIRLTTAEAPSDERISDGDPEARARRSTRRRASDARGAARASSRARRAVERHARARSSAASAARRRRASRRAPRRGRSPSAAAWRGCA